MSAARKAAARVDRRLAPKQKPRRQQQRSVESRAAILEAALDLFSHQGYHGTNIRDIAEAAKVSTGAVYYQFPDKETLFRALLDDYWTALARPDHPLNQALAEGNFPDNLTQLGRAARESVRKYDRYIALIYVDVVEFDGVHIQRFYADMASRFDAFLAAHPGREALEKRLRPGVSSVSAIMLATRFLLHYFAVEIVFRVPNHFGKDSDAVLGEIADILRYGMLRPIGVPPPE
ncbi:MAG: TetR/AcrR family transcriptional regulator [Vicinamibacteria bacterium]|nr:TetR/AcrR family transcriptional regulator [Vicinamibacteria bacterium]